MAKIEAGGDQINESVVDFPKLMEEIGQMFFPSAREKKIEMYFSGMDQVPRLVKTDRIKLSQILINLIQNALIFTNAGTINITQIPPCSYPWLWPCTYLCQQHESSLQSYL
jgi:hypothetical protein